MTTSDGQRSGLVQGLACCLMLGFLLPNLTGCGDGSGRPRVNRASGAALEPGDLAGRWKLQFVQVPYEVDFSLLQITYREKKYSAKFIGNEKQRVAPTLKSYDIKDDGTVRLVIDSGGIPSSFQGKLDGEAIWGTMLMPQFQLVPAKLEPTELTVLDPKTEPTQISTYGELASAQNAADQFVTLNDFVKKPESFRSPLLIEAYAVLAHYLKAEKYTLKMVQDFIAEYRQATAVWGPRMAPRVDLNVGKALAQQQLFPELAKELLTTAEKQIVGDYPFEWKLQLAESWAIQGDNEHALKLLKPLQEVDPTNSLIRFIYARAKEQTKDTDEAMKAYAGLAVVPMLEQSMARGASADVVLPSESAVRLWKQKHGDTKGFDEFLKTAYDDQMKLYVPQRKPTTRDAKGKVVLMELFTGAACVPCVPVDIACEALRHAYTPQEVIVIKYHYHAPLPDPLANEQTVERFAFYGSGATPTLAFNGHIIEDLGGDVTQASSLITRLKYGLELELKETTTVDLKLSAIRTGDDIEIKATVNGITTTDNDPRLILVLLENDVQYHAPNGIRVHNMVARGFAGGPHGVKLKPGDIDHVQTISLTKLKASLVAHLKQFEDQAGRQFPSKPMDLAKLQVVAIVQNQITRSHMQSIITDVVDATPSEAKPAEVKPDEAKPADAKPAEEKPAEAKPAEEKPAEAKP